MENRKKILKMYRLFITPFEEVKKQFYKNYGKENVFFAETSEDLKDILKRINSDILPNSSIVLLLDSSIFTDILESYESFYHLKYLEKRFQYIVLTGPEKDIKYIHKEMKNI